MTKNSFKDLFAEETSSGDIAVFTPPMNLQKKKLPEEEDEEIQESPVGAVGRTGYADADAHVTAALRAEFKKIVKKLGGKTVARKLLAEMNAGI